MQVRGEAEKETEAEVRRQDGLDPSDPDSWGRKANRNTSQ